MRCVSMLKPATTINEHETWKRTRGNAAYLYELHSGFTLLSLISGFYSSVGHGEQGLQLVIYLQRNCFRSLPTSRIAKLCTNFTTQSDLRFEHRFLYKIFVPTKILPLLELIFLVSIQLRNISYIN